MMTTYAVNLIDLLMFREAEPIISQILFNAETVTDRTVNAEANRVDTPAQVMQGGAERIEAIIEIMRLKYKKYQFRIYRSKTGKGGWKRV